MDIALNHVQLWEQLNKKYNDDKKFRNEVVEIIRFYGSKLFSLADNGQKREVLSEIIEPLILGQYFHGYLLMKILIENNDEQVFYPEFWEIPKGLMLNEIGKVMQFQYESEWAYHDGIKDYNITILNTFPDGYEIFRETALETANYGAYKAVIESEYYKGSELPNEEGLFFGDINDYHFVNPQVYIKAYAYSKQHELWELMKLDNGKVDSSWIGTIHLSTIPTDTENMNSYILSVSISDTIRMDEKSRIVKHICEKLPEEIRSVMQLRVYHLSGLEIVKYNN